MRSRRPILLLVLATISWCAVRSSFAAAGPPDPAARLTRALAEAETSLRQNEPEIAESRYRTALAEGWLLLGALAAVEGDLVEAARAFERAAGSVTDDRRGLMALAMVELEAGRAGEAANLLRRLAARNPADAEVRQSLARALAAAGSLEEAVQELEEVRVLAPEHHETLYTLATAYLRQGRPEAAQPLLTELAAERPRPETHVLIGRTWRDHGHHERARAALEAALELDPGVRRAHYYLGTVELLSEGRGRIEEAIGHFRAELEVAPDDPMTNLYLGIGLVESRRHEEALPPLETASRAAISRRDAFQFLGRSYLALDRPAEAVTALRRALELARAEAMELPDGVFVDLGESQLSSIHYQLALALRRTGKTDDAATHFARAREHSARLAESSREILSRYLGQEKPGSAPGVLGPPLEFPAVAGLEPAGRERLRRAVASAVARTYLHLGVFKSRESRFAGAARLFAAGAELDPGFPRLQYSLGVALFNDGQFEEATAPLTRAREESPEDADLRRMLALARLNNEDYEGAAELLRSDAGRRENPSLEYAYGLALVRSGRAAEAESVFAALLAENSEWPELNVVLGQAYAQQDEYEAAIGSLRRALELDPGVAEAHATLGDIFLRQGKLGEAEASLRAELAAHPEDERSRYTLAMVLDLNRRPEEAKRLLRQHLDARPLSADGRYLLGKILLAEGAAEDALEQLTAAADLAPEDANIRYQLGQALQKLGRADEARREFESFRRLKQALRDGGAP